MALFLDYEEIAKLWHILVCKMQRAFHRHSPSEKCDSCGSGGVRCPNLSDTLVPWKNLDADLRDFLVSAVDESVASAFLSGFVQIRDDAFRGRKESIEGIVGIFIPSPNQPGVRLLVARGPFENIKKNPPTEVTLLVGCRPLEDIKKTPPTIQGENTK